MATRQMRAVYAKEKKGHFMEGKGKITVVHYGKTHEILDGSGFFSDIFGKIKAAAKAGYEAVKRKVENPRYDYPPKVRAYLQKNAGGVINSIQIRRAPIYGSIEKFLNLLSLGQLQKAKEKYAYDKLYHLSMIIGFEINGQQKYMIAERNEVINIGDEFAANEDTEYINVPVYKQITVGELFDKAIKLEGRNFFIYDAFNNNCQKFIKSVLDANGLSTNESNNFILQDVAGIQSELPGYVAPVAKGITDVAAAVNRIIEGEGKPRIDFEKIKWGTFTKAFERFQKKHKDIKNIDEFADYVISHKDDFQKTTVRRARFYKNILKKHKISGGALFTNPRVAWQAQNIRNEDIRAPEVQKKYQERYEGVLKPAMDFAAKVGATGVLGPAGTAAAQAYNYATKLGQVLPVVGAVVGSGSKKLPSVNVINKWFENKAIDAYGRQLAIDTWLETNWLELLSMLQKEYKLSDEDVVNTIQSWFKSQVEKGRLTDMDWLKKWLDEPELLEGGGPGSSGVRKFNRGMKGKMLPLAVNVADAIISNRGNPVGMFSALVDTASNAAATAAQGGSVMKTALGGMKAYAKMVGGADRDDSQESQGAMTHYSISDDSEISEEDMDALLAEQEYQMERQRALSQNYRDDEDEEEDTFFGTEVAQEDDAARQQIAAARRALEELIGEPGSRGTTPGHSQNPQAITENPEGKGKKRKARGRPRKMKGGMDIETTPPRRTVAVAQAPPPVRRNLRERLGFEPLFIDVNAAPIEEQARVGSRDIITPPRRTIQQRRQAEQTQREMARAETPRRRTGRRNIGAMIEEVQNLPEPNMAVGDLMGLNPAFAPLQLQNRGQRRQRQASPQTRRVAPRFGVAPRPPSPEGMGKRPRKAVGGSKYKSKDEVLADLRETGMVREFGPVLFNKSRQELMNMLKEIYKQHPEKAPKKMVMPKKAEAAPVQKKPRGRPRKAAGGGVSSSRPAAQAPPATNQVIINPDGSMAYLTPTLPPARVSRRRYNYGQPHPPPPIVEPDVVVVPPASSAEKGLIRGPPIRENIKRTTRALPKKEETLAVAKRGRGRPRKVVGGAEGTPPGGEPEAPRTPPRRAPARAEAPAAPARTRASPRRAQRRAISPLNLEDTTAPTSDVVETPPRRVRQRRADGGAKTRRQRTSATTGVSKKNKRSSK